MNENNGIKFEDNELQALVEEMGPMLMQNFYNYTKASGADDINEEVIIKAQKALGIEDDDGLKIQFAGIGKYMAFNDPQYLWNRDVSEEIQKKLNDLINEDLEKFIEAFYNSQASFFVGLDAYRNAISFYNELKEVSYDDELKLNIFWNPLFLQITENCISNFYRFLREIINYFSEKDYSQQNTLGQLIDVLKANGLILTANIDTEIRNAIGHGNCQIYANMSNFEEITFRYFEGHKLKERVLSVWEYTSLIDKSLDIASGILVGIIKVLNRAHPIPSAVLVKSIGSQMHFEWIKLQYFNSKCRIQSFSESPNGDQLNINLLTESPSKEHLLVLLSETIKIAYINFPNYEVYFAGYKHSHCLPGWLRVRRSELDSLINEKNELDNAEIIKKADSIMYSDVLNSSIDSRAFNFHVFPKIQGLAWELTNMKDCSIPQAKRISAWLIIDEKKRKEEIKSVIDKAVEEIKPLYTPQNPKQKVPYGDIETDIIILEVYLKSNRRDTFGIRTDNKYFLCHAIYYRTEDLPKLSYGGFKKGKVSKDYISDRIGNIEIAWNPSFKQKKKKNKYAM